MVDTIMFLLTLLAVIGLSCVTVFAVGVLYILLSTTLRMIFKNDKL